MRNILSPTVLLMAVGMVQAGDEPSVGEAYAAVRSEWDSREEACRVAFEKATNDQERDAAWKLKPVHELDAYIDRFLAVAERDPKDPAARDALLWIANTGLFADHGYPTRIRNIDRAMDLILEHHRNDAKLGPVLLTMANYPTAKRDAFLRALYETTTARAVKGPACWCLAEYLRVKAEFAQHLKKPLPADETTFLEGRYGNYLKHLRSCDPGPMFKEAEALCERTLDEFGDLSYSRGLSDRAPKKTLAELAERSLNEIRHLAVGNEAPEIVGEDADGATFKLSEYRGKVIVLTFSGNWCGPCRDMYPEERALVERLKDRPFALLSVNTDESKDTLRKAIKDREITWRCWWEGRTDGPICSRWSIHGFPTLYVLDAKGVIRFKGGEGKVLEEQVAALLAEVEQPAGTK